MKQQQMRRRGVRRAGPAGPEEPPPLPPRSSQTATRRTADVLAAIDSVLPSS